MTRERTSEADILHIFTDKLDSIVPDYEAFLCAQYRDEVDSERVVERAEVNLFYIGVVRVGASIVRLLVNGIQLDFVLVVVRNTGLGLHEYLPGLDEKLIVRAGKSATDPISKKRGWSVAITAMMDDGRVIQVTVTG
jgi:hypothetical protein